MKHLNLEVITLGQEFEQLFLETGQLFKSVKKVLKRAGRLTLRLVNWLLEAPTLIRRTAPGESERVEPMVVQNGLHLYSHPPSSLKF